MTFPSDAGAQDAIRRYREAMTLDLAGDRRGAVRVLLAAPDPMALAVCTFGALSSFVSIIASEMGVPPLELWANFSPKVEVRGAPHR